MLKNTLSMNFSIYRCTRLQQPDELVLVGYTIMVMGLTPKMSLNDICVLRNANIPNYFGADVIFFVEEPITQLILGVTGVGPFILRITDFAALSGVMPFLLPIPSLQPSLV